MIRKVLWLLVLPLVLSGCSLVTSPKLPQITIDSRGNNFNFAMDKKFQVVLPANHTTGYQWEISTFSENNLELISNEYAVTEKYDEDVVGAGGEEVFTFKVKQVERSRIKMKYLRSWDSADPANDFSVTINGNPDDGLITYTGTIHSLGPDAQWDDYFETQDGTTFGIEPFMVNKIQDPGVKAKIADLKDTGTVVEIRGRMMENTIDYGGKQFTIHLIEFE